MAKKTTIESFEERRKLCTHDYLFRCKHKRIVIIMVDCSPCSKQDHRWVAGEISEAVMNGYTPERLPHDTAAALMKAEGIGCVDCRKEREASNGTP